MDLRMNLRTMMMTRMMIQIMGRSEGKSLRSVRRPRLLKQNCSQSHSSCSPRSRLRPLGQWLLGHKQCMFKIKRIRPWLKVNPSRCSPYPHKRTQAILQLVEEKEKILVRPGLRPGHGVMMKKIDLKKLWHYLVGTGKNVQSILGREMHVLWQVIRKSF